MTPEEILERAESLGDRNIQAPGEGPIQEDSITLLQAIQNARKAWLSPKELRNRLNWKTNRVSKCTTKLNREGYIQRWGGEKSNWGLTDKGKQVTPGNLL